ncbi:hypothetical protein Tco_0802314 [Tanacetum coccineum]|uniref:Uncharacterized protein n=1 Tax=Tanacetum coccineum TaxID=301880 RepID=A0ABQ5A1C8_9ASTR
MIKIPMDVDDKVVMPANVSLDVEIDLILTPNLVSISIVSRSVTFSTSSYIVVSNEMKGGGVERVQKNLM